MGYYSPTWKSGGTRPPYSQPNYAHVTNHDFGPDYKLHQPKLHGLPQGEYTLYWTFFHRSWFLSNLRLPWKNRVTLKFFTVSNIRFTFRILTTCACPENRVSPEIFHCIEYIFYHSGFLSNFVLALKNRVVLEFFTAFNILFTFRIFEQLACACPEKQSCPEFTVLIIYFLLFRIFEQLALALKTRGCPEIFRCIEYTFYYSVVLSNLRLPWKQSCPGIFHCIEYTFYIQNFWATCACPEKQRVLWIYFIECIFFLFRIFEQLALAPKNRVALEFFTVLKSILWFRIFEELAVAMKTEFSLKIFKPGGAAAPRPPASYAYGHSTYINNDKMWVLKATRSDSNHCPHQNNIKHMCKISLFSNRFFQQTSVRDWE